MRPLAIAAATLILPFLLLAVAGPGSRGIALALFCLGILLLGVYGLTRFVVWAARDKA